MDRLSRVEALDQIICAATCLSLMAEARDSELDREAVEWLAGQIVEIARSVNPEPLARGGLTRDE